MQRLRAKIVFADVTTNEYRVFIPELHEENENPKFYPVAILSETSVNITNCYTINQWVWVEFEKSNFHLPIIVGTINDTPNVKTIDITNNDILHITHDVSKNGLHVRKTKDNIQVDIDGDINLVINGVTYKSLLTQLNDMNNAITELQNFVLQYNTHVHPQLGVITPSQFAVTMKNFSLGKFQPKK